MNVAHKIKFTKGQDANQMLVKKLISNFLETGKVETTLIKAKLLKSKIDTLVYKVKHDKDKNKNHIYKYLDKKSMISIRQLTEHFDDRVGGYVRLVKTRTRLGDAAPMARIEWTIKPMIATPTPVNEGKTPVAIEPAKKKVSAKNK
jgi:large subunit ribosomal protein L17